MRGRNNDSAALILERFLRCLLQTNINIQNNIATRCGRLHIQRANNPALTIYFYLLITDFAVKNVFVVFLNAQFANVVGGRVVGLLTGFLDFLQVFFINFRHIAQRMGEGFFIRIVTGQARLDGNAGKTVATAGKASDFFFC